MTSPFYLPRNLFCDGKTYPEAELTATSQFVVVLAEPGGGKTALLESLAWQLGTEAVTANFFAAMGESEKNRPLVIDAFDELAKIDQTGINKVLAYARKANPTHVIISSRSSEWDEAATHRFKEFLGEQPLVVRLCEFKEDEQRKIFQDHAPNEDFTQFQSEVARFDLAMLLPNPQFLKLFADAYLESGNRFANKQSIFEKAVERLAREANPTVARPASPLSTTQKIDLASAAFAKLLLSGAEGVCTREATASHLYPFLLAMTCGDAADYGILATRLFKPGDHPNLHRPVHKIVTEYCAASYLIKRIADPTNGLTLSKCLAIIAPNSVVRDELRGLLGWMAALGDKAIQEAAIKLDAYAILANGDPSQLAPSSKLLLIRQLKEIETHDPYFRRGDAWRRFSVAGFFTQEVVDEIKLLLINPSEGNLRDLMLELLAEAPVLVQLTNELRQLVLAPQESSNTRSLAHRRLLEITSHDHRADLLTLISIGNQTSLELAANIIEKLGAATIEHARLTDFFRACAKLYPDHKKVPYERTIGTRYFIKLLIGCLDLPTIEWLLDELSMGLTCCCGKKSYDCYCRNGISKVIGSMLDQYFGLATPPFDPIRVWQWVGNLNFHTQRNPEQSKAVEVLFKNASLRQGVITRVFGSMSDHDQIIETKIHMFGLHSHSGLRLFYEDVKFIVELAFETDNPILWASFMATHPYYNKEDRGPNDLRRLMRMQAMAKPQFMFEWVKANREAAQFARDNYSLWSDSTRSMRRHRKRQNDIRIANIKNIDENRELVESGRHWGFLEYFARLVLLSPEKIAKEIGDEVIVRNALRNCLDFIAPKVPDLSKRAELCCESAYLPVETTLYAACLEILHINGNLEGVDRNLLRTLRTNIHMHYSAVANDDRSALKAEVDRIIFAEPTSAEEFLREYLEPQLTKQKCMRVDIWQLREGEAFSHLRATLSLEWLRRFPDLALEPLKSLFAIAAIYAERDQLNQIISARCAALMAEFPNQTENEDIEQKRQFWLVCAWYFLPAPPETYWKLLSTDRELILLLNQISGRHSHYDYQNWPKLSATKVESILIAFVDHWPKVDLPDYHGSDDPKEEVAYRFLTEVIWSIESDNSDDAIAVIGRLLADSRFADIHKDIKSIRAAKIRKQALQNFQPPTPHQIQDLLEHNQVVTVEGLRQLVVEELEIYQKEIFGGEFNQGRLFYAEDNRLGEEACRDIIADRLRLKLERQNITVTPEHQLKAEKRSDFTVAKTINGKRRLLVTEVKGQWHKDLYTAAAAQLSQRYAIHPDAEEQGIYLVLWFGPNEEVAARKKHSIASAKELKNSIAATLPPELKGKIDIIVLDVSKR